MTWLDLHEGVIAEFCCSGSVTRSDRFEAVASWEADLGERKREADADRKRRTRSEILAELRRLQDAEAGACELDFSWRTCPACGLLFAVLLPERGRPRVHCCRAHAVLSAVRGWRGRR